MTISAKIIAHSSHPGCPDLITLQARYPRFIHAEVMTHRVFSRNASSSRAVPIDRMIKEVMEDPAMPVAWGSNQPGMQAGAEVERKEEAICMWLEARDRAVDAARDAQRIGLHKQIVNRLIEPFAHISVVITATEWDNFFDLRCHPAADPTMRALSEAMRDAIAKSTATTVELSEWHMPYGGDHAMISAARCARVSYLNHDGSSPDGEKDFALADMLAKSKHWSPFEHPATPSPGIINANLRGWCSLRTLMGA
jgi:thymidylate synthase ThyX